MVMFGFRFTEKRSLQIHMRKHTGERPYACKFPGCGKVCEFTRYVLPSNSGSVSEPESKRKLDRALML